MRYLSHRLHPVPAAITSTAVRMFTGSPAFGRGALLVKNNLRIFKPVEIFMPKCALCDDNVTQEDIDSEDSNAAICLTCDKPICEDHMHSGGECNYCHEMSKDD